jgi:hypothetical protein
MAQMTVAEVLTAIRATTNHGTADADDSQTTNAMMTAKIDREYKHLRRQLVSAIPELGQLTGSGAITAIATNTIAFPTGYERLIRLERLISGTDYYPLEVADPLNAHQASALSYVENGGASVWAIYPRENSIGTYRITYVAGVVSGYTSLTLLPEGLEEVVIERVAAWVRQRHDEDPTYHLTQASRLYKEALSSLRKRYGKHGRSAMVHTGRWD